MMTDDTLTSTPEAEVASRPAEDADASHNSLTDSPSTSTATTEPPSASLPAEHRAEDRPEPTPHAVAHAPEPAQQREQPEAQISRDRSEDERLFEAAMEALESGEDVSTEGTYKKLSRGDRVEATVIQVDRDRVFVDLGTNSEGIVPLGELTEESIESASDHVKVGDKIQVVVMRPEGAEGNPLVSKKRADFEDAWDRIESAFAEGKTLTAQVIDRVKGGLVVDIGVRGFVPATHVGGGKLRNIEKFVGQTLPLKIIEIDRERKKVVLSNRLAEDEKRANAKDEIFKNVSPGDVLEGAVRRLTDYGAFIDLGGVDGLLHISEMSWMRINHPKEMFREGQKIKVMVLRLDAGAGKISLGHRQVLPDPWNLIKENYNVGQRITTKISRLVMSGAFVKLPEGAEAFIPLSEMSTRRVKRPEDVVQDGQEVEVQIIDLRPEDRRMVLSMRATGHSGGGGDQGRQSHSPVPQSFDDDDRGPKRGKKGKKGGKGGRPRGGEDDLEEIVGRRGYATGGATIGERLGMLKGFDLGREEEEEIEHEAEQPEEPAPEESSE